ncbi:MAG: glutamate--tRNA ligase [Phycisphaerales bacterium]|nr:glutamate--tRNA ligase [Phycisphaerales bacterium]
MTNKVRTRFAPSPTGHLHVGGARTAIYCWAYARGRDGTFILRIEDTDQKRSSEQATFGFFEDLNWLGIDWDEGPAFNSCGGGDVGPYLQSQRLELYKEHLQTLFDNGLAYYAFETPEELNEKRKQARTEKRAYRYDRAALELSEAQVKANLEADMPHVIRFKVPDDAVLAFKDEVIGDVEIARSELDDFVIFKADGYPTYHFAVVVDDALMGATDVVRGQEHLNNTYKHIVLQDALGFERPNYAHLSLIFNPDGSKMSKRDKDKALRTFVKEHSIESPPNGCIPQDVWEHWLSSKDNQLQTDEASDLATALGVSLPEINVDDFKAAGYLPEVLLNYLCLLGWSPGDDIEQFDSAFLIEKFSLDRIVKSPAKFDRAKLLAFNLDAMQALSSEAFEERLLEWCNEYAPEFASLGNRFSLFAKANHERSKTFRDAIETSKFLVEPDETLTWEETKPVKKALLKGELTGLSLLPEVATRLSDLSEWTHASIDGCMAQCAEELAEGKLGKVAQPVRIAVAGSPVSPPIGDTLVLLGKESTLKRIERCMKFFGSKCDA